MSDTFTKLFAPARPTAVVDIGANPVDGEPPYRQMLDLGLCTVVGFEPQSNALRQLQAGQGPLETYLPYAVGDGGEHTLHVCVGSGMTSLLEPNPHILRQFHRFPELGKVVEKRQVRTRLLDSIAEIEHLDFLKMDVQGSELSILHGGRTKLAQAVAVQTEVSFIPLYKNQPLFWEIDKELREQGFVPHRFMDVRRLTIAPLLIDNDPTLALSQLVEADVLYVRNFFDPEAMSIEQWKHLAVVAQYYAMSPDLVLHVLRSLVALRALSERAPFEYLAKLQALDEKVAVSMVNVPLPEPIR